MRPPRFNTASSFHADLKQKIKNYFIEKSLKQTGNLGLYLKAIILVALYIGTYIILLFFTPHWAIALIGAVFLGGLAATIGFNVMHDGAHGSFSRKKWVNELAGHSINFLGANVFMWKTKHNVVHHSFTNVDEIDDDMNARPFLRLCPNQKFYGIHKYQHWYFLMVYSLLYLYWVFVTDYKKYITGKVGIIPIQKMNIYDHLSFWGFKLIHLGLFIVLPILTVGWLYWLVGFLVYGIATGIFLSVVFQLAHSVEETSFPLPDVVSNQLEDDWAIHQLKTTSNFATHNKVLSWLVGGLNFQVEHHLFPNISHVHYPAISKIIKETCLEYGIPYLEHPKFRLAFASHVNHLKILGKG
ncbi:fatty acid desaturase family protein [Belliella kenyensis]|uniref:Fatty acid desaturase family protein n=1 Tax=Belliella kenyensis TaxID=1472724 RepID=A0ABV8ERB6_9BACT|nr:acyl-CoA desaturase [Belliella kenyensis]MCH7402583.1 acyl-CoA desaturase [Belliella kenyensis]MDN3603381.1 acyl-CoA desaturase [Belliella kenyensis]